MADINKAIAASTTAGLIVLAIGAGVSPTVAVAWPEIEKPIFSRQLSNSTYSAVRYAELSNVSGVNAFEAAVQNVFSKLLKSQTSLGAEFEAAMYSDLEGLYEA
ncbi:hypothetical protein NBH20_01305 [Rhizobium sp. S153]|uniref:Uncharacterized protein n=1 Tax=Ciceribacter sichuanensis TaxID=2949647 RepID=A0ABT0V5Q8_9HYPH|nr:hypothetical protein [Ciceribacter sp. S153]MCM2399778.1 hypothetical protein [Ciceribacter sp. S153]